ncbi:uncharacterized protein BDZ99DRAFT_399767 [Mytilinidion resinicola]|uniref:Uncharacterized protein n=1 Tax=Mytilinidion resinicola TaxID=574789 RepID=A0A6A6Y642_9PEZI|nr:uncharacterized protein BDZ99DRAFT_399767 [Mytilinidion resinicola]KAF2803267.1 hypothetical protein BDZ99DRAFT_399767 [Mytilinidion resinicola]
MRVWVSPIHALRYNNSNTSLATDGGEAVLANFTVYAPGKNENILSMEKFHGMLKSVDCTANNSLSLTFKDDATFAYAQKVWDWVNGADNHTFIMVAGVGDCGSNTRRLPFVVSSLKYDEEANTAFLTASKSEWKKVAHSYDLVVGTLPKDALQTRDITKDIEIDATSSFPFSVTLGSGDLSATLVCANCSTAGKFHMQFKISQKFFIPTGASMTVQPESVSAIAAIKLVGAGAITGDLSKTWDIVKIPIDGISIPEILDLGPFLTVSVGVQLGPLTISAGISSGATATLDDAAILEVDLLDPSSNQFSGWMPNVESLPVTVDARVTGTVSIFAQPSLQLRADALGHGFEIGLNLRVPNVNAKLEVIEAPAGACPADEIAPGTPRHKTGVRISTNIGGQLNVAVATTQDEADPFLNFQIASLDKPLAQACWEFGDLVDSSPATSSLVDVKTSATVATPSSTAPASETVIPPASTTAPASGTVLNPTSTAPANGTGGFGSPPSRMMARRLPLGEY